MGHFIATTTLQYETYKCHFHRFWEAGVSLTVSGLAVGKPGKLPQNTLNICAVTVVTIQGKGQLPLNPDQG